MTDNPIPADSTEPADLTEPGESTEQLELFGPKKVVDASAGFDIFNLVNFNRPFESRDGVDVQVTQVATGPYLPVSEFSRLSPPAAAMRRSISKLVAASDQPVIETQVHMSRQIDGRTVTGTALYTVFEGKSLGLFEPTEGTQLTINCELVVGNLLQDAEVGFVDDLGVYMLDQLDLIKAATVEVGAKPGTVFMSVDDPEMYTVFEAEVLFSGADISMEIDRCRFPLFSPEGEAVDLETCAKLTNEVVSLVKVLREKAAELDVNPFANWWHQYGHSLIMQPPFGPMTPRGAMLTLEWTDYASFVMVDSHDDQHAAMHRVLTDPELVALHDQMLETMLAAYSSDRPDGITGPFNVVWDA